MLIFLARTARSSRSAERGEVLAVEEDASGGRLQQPVEHAQQRGLAGAGQTHDDEDLARFDGEGGVDHRGGRALGAQLLAVGAASSRSTASSGRLPNTLYRCSARSLDTYTSRSHNERLRHPGRLAVEQTAAGRLPYAVERCNRASLRGARLPRCLSAQTNGGPVHRTFTRAGRGRDDGRCRRRAA